MDAIRGRLLERCPKKAMPWGGKSALFFQDAASIEYASEKVNIFGAHAREEKAS
jgi:hypothetical protein